MKKECIFKAWVKGEIYSIYRMPVLVDGFGALYRVYHGRRWLGHCAFDSKQEAIRRCLHFALHCDVDICGEAEL